MGDDIINYNFPPMPVQPIVTLSPSYSDDTEKAIVEACNSLAATLIAKRKDYGKGNIERHGEFGVIVRADDKLARLINLWKLDSAENEPIEDSWKDLAGYAIIGLLFRQGKW